MYEQQPMCPGNYNDFGPRQQTCRLPAQVVSAQQHGLSFAAIVRLSEHQSDASVPVCHLLKAEIGVHLSTVRAVRVVCVMFTV